MLGGSSTSRQSGSDRRSDAVGAAVLGVAMTSRLELTRVPCASACLANSPRDARRACAV